MGAPAIPGVIASTSGRERGERERREENLG
jgi:hypothetical protein